MQAIQILIIDMGSQYTMVIGRTLRELGFRSAILSPKNADKWLKINKPKAIILSGGSASTFEAGAPQPPEGILELGIPILGICYGMQWLVKNLGGELTKSLSKKEYGRSLVKRSGHVSDLIGAIFSSEFQVWASHGDSIKKLPEGCRIEVLTSPSQDIVGFSNEAKKVWGLLFHPEVSHSQNGKKILQDFVEKICGCNRNWWPKDLVQAIRDEVAAAVGYRKAIIGFSGGVDSTTLAAILAPVMRFNLVALTIDTGALRENELVEIQANAKAAGIPLLINDAAERFQEILSDCTDAEEKRRRFKKLYATIFEEVAKDIGAEFLVQGSLATDFIESGKLGESALIKSHHNIGLDIKLQELHPLRELFKYEVREIAKSIGLPDSVTQRQPFPGPGLFLRVVGEPATRERLDIVRWADAEVTAILKKSGLFEQISQLVVGLICIRTVGVKGDARSYGYAIAVRAVETSDFMTASGSQFPPEVRREIMTTVTKHPEIVRVWFDENDKPPATTEFE